MLASIVRAPEMGPLDIVILRCSRSSVPFRQAEFKYSLQSPQVESANLLYFDEAHSRTKPTSKHVAKDPRAQDAGTAGAVLVVQYHDRSRLDTPLYYNFNLKLYPGRNSYTCTGDWGFELVLLVAARRVGDPVNRWPKNLPKAQLETCLT
eukprot:1830923-Rhodomonas_salina.1